MLDEAAGMPGVMLIFHDFVPVKDILAAREFGGVRNGGAQTLPVCIGPM